MKCDSIGVDRGDLCFFCFRPIVFGGAQTGTRSRQTSGDGALVCGRIV